jgi:hypothetical protein
LEFVVSVQKKSRRPKISDGEEKLREEAIRHQAIYQSIPRELEAKYMLPKKDSVEELANRLAMKKEMHRLMEENPNLPAIIVAGYTEAEHEFNARLIKENDALNHTFSRNLSTAQKMVLDGKVVSVQLKEKGQAVWAFFELCHDLGRHPDLDEWLERLNLLRKGQFQKDGPNGPRPDHIEKTSTSWRDIVKELGPLLGPA